MIGAGGRRRGRLARGEGPAAHAARLPGSIRSRRSRRPRSPSGRPTPCTGPGFLAVYVAGLVLGSAAIPAKRTVTVFHQGLALGRADLDVPRARAARVPEPTSTTSRSRAPRSRWCSCSWRGRWRPSSAPPSTAFSAAERVVLGWAGLRGAVPVVLATFPVIDDVAPLAGRSSTSSSSRSSSRRSSRGRPSSRSRSGSGSPRTSPRCRARWRRPGTIRRLGRRGRGVPGRRRRTRVVGHRVRELGLPRDALLSVIVRGERGGAAARLDADRGGRPPARGRAQRGGDADGASVSSAGRPGRSASAAAERGALARARRCSARGPGTRSATATPRIHEAIDGVAGARAPAYAPRPPRRARRRWPTAATRSPADARGGRRARRCRRTPGADWRARPTTPRGRGGRR